MNTEKEIIDLLSQIGKLLLQHGAETDVVESDMKMVASKLGYKDVEILILPNSLLISLLLDGRVYNTKLQRVDRQDVNFKVLDRVGTLIANIDPSTDIKRLLEELKDESSLSSMNPYYLRNLMAGVGCGSFSLLFGGDFYIFVIVFIASAVGFFLNNFLLNRYVNPFVTIIIVAFSTTMISGVMTLNSEFAQIAISSSILFLVPSVAFINSTNDLIKRHYTNGIIRGVRGIIISFAIAIGISIALNILWMENFV